jgi:hypothetical protein
MVLCTNSNYIHEPGRLVEACGKGVDQSIPLSMTLG